MSPAELKSVATLEPRRDLVPTSWQEIMARAEMFSKSGLLPVALKGKAADIAIILQMGCELDIPPMQAINGISVIQGKPTVDPQLAIALVRSRLPNAVIKFDKLSETEAVVTMIRDRNHPDESYTATWNMLKAKNMGLADKPNYKSQPGNMLKWRAVMEAARAVFPDILKGLYSSEEMGDDRNNEQPPVQDQTKAQDLAALINAKEVIPEVMPVAAPKAVKPKAEPGLVNINDAIHELAGVQVPPVAESKPEMSVLGDYVAPMGELAGKRLNQVPAEVLKNYVGAVMADYKKKGKTPAGKAMEMLFKMEAYLSELESDFDPNFADDVHL